MATADNDKSCVGSTYIILTILFACFALFLLITLIPMFISFYKNVRKQLEAKASDTIPKLLKKIMDYSGTFISVLVIFSILIQTIYVIDFCITGQSVLDAFSNFNYILQAVSMLILWFTRIKSVVMGTQFAISKCVTYVYISVFVILFSLAALLSFIVLTPNWEQPYDHDKAFKGGKIISQATWWTLMMILATGYLCALISVSALFVYKLVMVYKRVLNDDKLISLITKITILNFTSILLTIVMSSTLALYGLYTYARFINGIALLLDFYTNFWAVMLSYRYFDGYYDKVCHCLDVKCNNCWFKCIHGQDRDTVKQLAQSQSSKQTTATESSI